jgi:putative transposase
MAFLIHNNDKNLTSSFNFVFYSDGIKILHTPYQAPKANAFAERWVRSVREKCYGPYPDLDRKPSLPCSQREGEYYNHARPHQGIGQRFPVFMSRPKRCINSPMCRPDVLRRRLSRLPQAAFIPGF